MTSLNMSSGEGCIWILKYYFVLNKAWEIKIKKQTGSFSHQMWYSMLPHTACLKKRKVKKIKTIPSYKIA